MKSILGYVRVSTEEQAIHGLSIEAQTAAVQNWARANGHKLVDVYVDAGISARKPASKRPELQRLLSDVREKRGDLIVFTKLDRWFRNIAEYYKVQEVLEAHHVDWKTIQEDYDTSTASGRLKINIMLSVAQDEADRTSERIKAVFERKREKLEPVSGRLPIGYIISGKKIVKDPKTEELVSDVFQKYMACGSISETQRFILEKYEVRMLYQRVSKMLQNAAYFGCTHGMDGMCPAYITREQFDKIQETRMKIVRKTKGNRVYIFSGLTFCGECGKRMTFSPARGNASPVCKCRAHHIEKSGCMNKVCITEKKIERYLLDMVKAKAEEYAITSRRLNGSHKEKSYKPEIASIRAKISRVKELYINDIISLEECKEQNSALNARLEDLLEKDRPAKTIDLSKIQEVLQTGWESDYADISKSEKQEFWRILIKEITIYPDRRIDFDLNL